MRKDILIDREFLKTAVEFLKWRNKFADDHVFNPSEVKEKFGPRIDRVLEALEKEELASRGFNGELMISGKKHTTAFLDECKSQLKDKTSSKRWETIMRWLGVAGFILSVLDLILHLIT